MSETNDSKRQRVCLFDARKRAYLEALTRTGSRREASRIASPHATGGAASTFRSLEARDPAFAAQVQEALDAFLGRGEAAIAERAFAPSIRESLDKAGNVRSRETSWRDANYLLLRLLAKNDPAWRENRKVEVDGRIEHAQADCAHSYRIDAADVLALPEEDRRALLELIGKVETNRLAAEQGKGNGQFIDQSALALPALESGDGDGDGSGAPGVLQHADCLTEPSGSERNCDVSPGGVG